MSTRKKPTALPISLAPRGLNRDQAAEYIGIGTTLFDDWVNQVEKAGRKLTYCIGARKLYDRRRLDAAIDEMVDAAEIAVDDPFAPERQAA